MSAAFNTHLSDILPVMDTENNTDTTVEKRGVGRPSKDVERFTTTLDRETLVWAKAYFGERGVGPWINAALQAERERIEATEALAEKRARKDQ